MLQPSVGGAYGVTEDPSECRLWARGTSFVKGQVGMLDIGLSQATHNRDGEMSSGLSTLVTPNTSAGVAASKFAFLFVAKVDIGRDSQGLCKCEGLIEAAYVHKASGDIAADEELYAVDGQKYLTADGAVGDRVVAKCLEVVVGPSTPKLARILFTGIHGLRTKTS